MHLEHHLLRGGILCETFNALPRSLRCYVKIPGSICARGEFERVSYLFWPQWDFINNDNLNQIISSWYQRWYHRWFGKFVEMTSERGSRAKSFNTIGVVEEHWFKRGIHLESIRPENWNPNRTGENIINWYFAIISYFKSGRNRKFSVNKFSRHNRNLWTKREI